MSKSEKKGCCLFKIIKWVLMICGVLFVVAFFSVLNDESSPSESAQSAAIETIAKPTDSPVPFETPVPTNSPEPTASPVQADAPAAAGIPGINGSNAYDPVIDLDSKGIKKPKTVTTADGIFEWTSEDVWIGSTLVSYQIHANEKHEILDATFTMAGQDNGFLIYAASLPYAAAEKEKAVQFVKDHMTGESASITIGDAIFSIYPNERGAMLEIKDIDSDAFYSELLDKKLGL